MDGYYVDPEGVPGKPYEWDQPGLAAVADRFCRTVSQAAAGKPFGVTSDYRADSIYPSLPSQTFFTYVTKLLPQAY